MSVYVCHEHQVGFEEAGQARAHFSFGHKSSVNTDELEEDELPEGYRFRSAAEKVIRRPKVRERNEDENIEDRHEDKPVSRASQRHSVAVIPPEDAEAQKLSGMLRSLNIPEDTVNAIVNGFINIPQFRSHPHALGQWLETNITNTKMKSYIPLVVQDVFADITPSNPGMYYDYPPPNHPRFYGYPRAEYPARYPSPYDYPPPENIYRSPQDSELEKRVNALSENVSGVLSALAKDREERVREREQQQQKEREELIDKRFERLENAVMAAVSSKSDDVGETSGIQALKEELRGLREQMSDEHRKTLEAKIEELSRAIANSKPDTVGRTTEDIIHEVGPLALEKLDKMGDGLRQEVRELREHAMPKSDDILEMNRKPRSLTEIAELAELENDILSDEDLDKNNENKPSEFQPVLEEVS